MKKFLQLNKWISGKQPDKDRDQWVPESSHPGHNQHDSQQPSLGSSECDVPPPAYSPSSHADFKATSSSLDSPNDVIVPEHLQKYSNGEDQFAFLSYFDTVFVIDDSGSMAGKSWEEVAGVLRAITPICTAHDKDGIDLYFLNHQSKAKNTPEGKAPYGYYNIETPEEITGIFDAVEPYGSTRTGSRLRSILRPYVGGLPPPEDKSRNIDDVKPINIIVITDGEPSDDPDPVITKYARDLDKLDAAVHQVGIQFFQVGNMPRAAQALNHLDDLFGPKSDVRDMVDTVSWDANPGNHSCTKTLSEDTVLKVVLGSVIRRLDKLPAVKQD
ncbi:hypothetical protein GGI42DRAFT_365776 [Trichoderma sp. SZMC 28013]